ncbi:MAG: hypothetical protein CM15mP36_15420 [Flavobacteriales bacterium]|nr:MAG: hypothetical protein CM15mP36_15420 [Flavobacteriales bacterium]
MFSNIAKYELFLLTSNTYLSSGCEKISQNKVSLRKLGNKNILRAEVITWFIWKKISNFKIEPWYN